MAVFWSFGIRAALNPNSLWSGFSILLFDFSGLVVRKVLP